MSSLSNPCLIEVAADRIDSDSAIQAQDVLAVSCCGVFRQLHSQLPRETVRCPQQPVLPLTSLHFEKCACVNTPRLEFAIKVQKWRLLYNTGKIGFLPSIIVINITFWLFIRPRFHQQTLKEVAFKHLTVQETANVCFYNIW